MSRNQNSNTSTTGTTTGTTTGGGGGGSRTQQSGSGSGSGSGKNTETSSGQLSMSSHEANCTVLISNDKGVPPTQNELTKALEDPDPRVKVSGLKTLILLLLNGQKLPNMLMTVIRYCVTVEDHELKKVLYLYYEVVDKYAEGTSQLRPEMILVCNALRQDLNHPNEYIRGSALRFLCKIKEPEIMEPLIASVKQNLSHRHPYVRRNAVMTVFTTWKGFGEDFFPDADELVESVLENESDQGVRRNAFLTLYQMSPSRAQAFFAAHAADLPKYGDGFQLVVLELTRKVCRKDPSQKSRFIKVVFQLLQSNSHAVCYEAAWTLVSLSAAPTAVRAAASTYTQLLAIDTDTNVKLIVLEKLAEMKKHHSKVLEEILMDILRALSSPSSEIRRKTLQIAMDLVSPRNIKEVVSVLKKEIVKTQSKDQDRAAASEYRHMLIKSIHKCAVKYPSIAESVVHVLMDFLNGNGALDVVLFVREIVETYPHLRAAILSKLIDCFPEIRAGHVYRVAIWILAEYAEEEAVQAQAMDVLEECLGPLPFRPPDDEGTSADKDKEEASKASPVTGGGAQDGGPHHPVSRDEQVVSQDGANRTRDDGTMNKVPAREVDHSRSKTQLTTTVTILPDGSYATQTAMTEAQANPEADDDNNLVLRNLILEGDYMLGSVVIVAMTKMILRSSKHYGRADSNVKEASMKLLQLCCSLISSGRKAPPARRLDQDSYDRISLCMRALLDENVGKELEHILLNECRQVFAKMLASEKATLESEATKEKASIKALPEDLITFRQLQPRNALGLTEIELDDAAYLMKAVGEEGSGSKESNGLMSHLGKVHQLTGFTDPVYVEAQVKLHDYDIVLNLLSVNRTPQTLTNFSMELATVGDMKLVERPSPVTIAPYGHKYLRANIKVSSTETGTVFGTVSYDTSSSAQSNILHLNDIQLDIMDYVQPAHISDTDFRQFWAEFEWENKVAVNTVMDDVNEFLEHIITCTHMQCLTPIEDLEGQNCDFLAANLYARSLFGEDALVNVSVEKVNGKVEGYIRIRAKTQGIALSLGDRITVKQKRKDEEKKKKQKTKANAESKEEEAPKVDANKQILPNGQ